MNRPQRLLIVSHVTHYRHEHGLFAYGAYAREIDIWADLFPEVVIAAPLRQEKPPGEAIAFTRSNISVSPQLETGGESLAKKILQVFAIPVHCWRLIRAMQRADAIHVRCPGNLGLFGCILAPLFAKPRVAKYAGQWSDYAGQPMSWGLQKWLLRSNWWRAPVLVYGKWPGQPEHIIPFFTSVMDQRQMDGAQQVALHRPYRDFRRVLFVGRLTAERNVDSLLQGIAVCRSRGVDLFCRIVGDGEMREKLQNTAAELGLGESVSFAGALPYERVMGEYEKADVLVLVAESEGWGKAIVEGMAFGLVCVGANRGLVPWILGEGRGLVLPPRAPGALADALCQIASNPETSARMARGASTWAQNYSLDKLKQAIQRVLEASWAVELAGRTSSEPVAV